MSSLKKILIATDFSKSAGFAMKRAVQFAEANKTSLTAFHVLPENWIGKTSQWLAKSKKNPFLQFKHDAQQIFNKKIKPNLSNVKTNFVVKQGREDEAIIQYAKDKKFDFLVMGAQGHYFFHEYFLGTTAESVLKKSLCPILVVKRKPSLSYKKILVPIDFSVASQCALKFAYKYFPTANIELLHVADLWYDQSPYRRSLQNKREATLHKQMQNTIKEEMKNFIERCKISSKNILCTVRGGYPEKVIDNEIREKKFDLVIIGTRGQTELHYLLIGGTAERVLKIVSTDIIVVPPE